MTDFNQTQLLRLLAARLERLSADSIWARRASGLRGNMLKVLEEIDSCRPVGNRCAQTSQIIHPLERRSFAQFTLFGYLAQLLQVPYTQLFVDKSETEIDNLLRAFRCKNCEPNELLINALKKHMQG